jgi:hypothetical protein
VTLNALADWGAKQVALKDKDPSVALPPHTLSPGKWCLVDVPPPAAGAEAVSSAVQQSDPASVRRLMTTRVEQALLEAKLHPDPSAAQPTRLNTSDLWVEESTAVLRRPSGKHATQQTQMPDEQLTKHYCQMAYGSTRYNADALAKEADLAAAQVKGPNRQLIPFTTHCRLCTQAGAPPQGEDSLHHVFHACTAPTVVAAKAALRTALTQKVREISHCAMSAAEAARVADKITQRDDYYAGQISLEAHDLIAAAMRAHALSQPPLAGQPDSSAAAPRAAPKVGNLQQIVLRHSKKIHDLRCAKIPARLRLSKYRKAMWANQRAARRAAQAAAAAPPPAAQADASADDGS